MQTLMLKASQQVFTTAELARYDGSDSGKPIYLSIKGDVFDVTLGRHMFVEYFRAIDWISC